MTDYRPLVSVLPVLLAAGFWLWCLVDFTRTDERDMGLFARPVWVLWLSLGSLLGALLWFFAGRPESGRNRR